MKQDICSVVMVGAMALMSGGLSFAQNPGQAIYKSKCMHCHGVAGMADTAMARALKVKPITDPEVAKMSLVDMMAATRNGMGKMQAYKDELTAAEIKSSTEYFRTFIK